MKSNPNPESRLPTPDSRPSVACIADLLGPVAAAKGIRCGCRKCVEQRSQQSAVSSQQEKPQTADCRLPTADFKMQAAHDVNGSDE